MSRLKFPYHLKLNEATAFLNAWKNTPAINLKGWEQIASTMTISTQALVWSMWWVWNRQMSDPTILNWMFIEWMYRDTEIFWPMGSTNIPISALGSARCGWCVPALTSSNAVI